MDNLPKDEYFKSTINRDEIGRLYGFILMTDINVTDMEMIQTAVYPSSGGKVFHLVENEYFVI